MNHQTNELFTLDKTKPVCFFYKLPEHIRKDYEEIYKEMLPEEDLMWIQEKKWVEHYMKDISPDKFKNHIVKYTDDLDYFTFYTYFEILQPAIKTIVNGNDLYNQYPEYLI